MLYFAYEGLKRCVAEEVNRLQKLVDDTLAEDPDAALGPVLGAIVSLLKCLDLNCLKGKNRTAAMAVAFVIAFYHMVEYTIEEIMQYIVQARPRCEFTPFDGRRPQDRTQHVMHEPAHSRCSRG